MQTAKTTIKGLEQLRISLLEECGQVHGLRVKCFEAEREIFLAQQGGAAYKARYFSGYPYYNGPYPRDIRRAQVELEANQARLRALAPQIREKAAALDGQAEEAWQFIASSSQPKWARVAQLRPRVLRGEGVALLCRLAALGAKPERALICLYLLRELQEVRRTEGLSKYLPGRSYYGAGFSRPWYQDLAGVNSSGFGAVLRWTRDNGMQLQTQLHRLGFAASLERAQAWRRSAPQRAMLQGAGVRLGVLPSGKLKGCEVRLMSSQHFSALSDYLNCCIGRGATYRTRADQKRAAFVCLYDRADEMPVMLAELEPQQGRMRVVQAQKKNDRRPEEQADLQAWAADKFQLFAQALGVKPAREESLTVGEDLAHGQAFRACQPSGWSSRVSYDFTVPVRAVLEGEAEFANIYQQARSNLIGDAPFQLGDELCKALQASEQTESKMAGYRWARVVELDREAARLTRQADRLREQLALAE